MWRALTVGSIVYQFYKIRIKEENQTEKRVTFKIYTKQRSY